MSSESQCHALGCRNEAVVQAKGYQFCRDHAEEMKTKAIEEMKTKARLTPKSFFQDEIESCSVEGCIEYAAFTDLVHKKPLCNDHALSLANFRLIRKKREECKTKKAKQDENKDSESAAPEYVCVVKSCGLSARYYDTETGRTFCPTHIPKSPLTIKPLGPSYDPHTFSTGATRSSLKPDYSYVELILLQRVAAVMTEGEKKYGRDNWKKGGEDFINDIPNHMLEHVYGILTKDETEDHVAHLACNCMMLMWLVENQSKT